MSDADNPSPTRASEEAKAREASLSDLLRVGSDSNAMLLGYSGSDGEEGPAPGDADTSDATPAAGDGAAEASVAPEAEAGPTAGAVEPAAQDPGSAKPASTARTHAGTPVFGPWHAAGIAVAALGALLVVAPHVSTGLAQALECVLEPRVDSGLLVVGGLLLFTFGVSRRSLRSVERSLEGVGGETARLGKIAQDGRAVRDSLQTVRLENTSLKEDVAKLQSKIRKLTEIVSNPDYAGSMFRLAASVDLHRKHVDLYMKEQFGLVVQRLTAIAQQADHAEQQMKTALSQVHALTKEQLRVQQLAVREGFDQVHASSDKAAARIEQGLQTAARIEASLHGQQEAVSKGWSGLSDRLSLSVGQVASGLAEMRANLDRQAENQSASMRAEFAAIDKRIGAAERSQVSGVQQLSEIVHGRLGSRIEELQQGLKQISDLAARSQQEIGREFHDLAARLDKQSREQSSSMQQVRDRATEATRTAKGELAASLEQLGAHLEQLAREQASALRKSSHEAQEAAGSTQREIAASLEQVGSRLEKALESRTKSLSADLTELASRLQSVTQEVRSCLADAELHSASPGIEPAFADPADAPGATETPADLAQPPAVDGSSPTPEVREP
jgi:hypothetical protein